MTRAFAFAMITLTALAPFATAANAGHRHTGRNLAIGLGAVAATAIIIDQANRRGYRPRMSCGELLDRCNDGSDWACRKYERRCE